MVIRFLAMLAVTMAPASAVLGAPKACVIATAAELPVTMSGMKPMVPVTIDGQPVMMMADSGAFATLISARTATDLHLPTKLPPRGFETDMTVEGIGGSAKARIAIAKTFALGKTVARNVQLVVAGSETGGAGLLGRPILMFADTDYDLAAGIIRIVKPMDCGGASLAYWAGSKPVSLIPIEPEVAERGIFGTVTVNGVALRAAFDTGSSYTILSMSAAARLGLKPGGPDVTEDADVHGIGRRAGKGWIARIDDIKIGGEEIRHTRLRFGEVSGMGIDMFVGADFFLSHHVYVAAGQRKLYFTYNGGPMFDIGGKSSPARPPATNDPDSAGR